MPDSRQRDIGDVVIEDPELEAELEAFANNEEAASRFRGASKRIKEIILDRHKGIINGDRDGEHSGYVVCGQYRFAPVTTDRPAKTVEINQSEGIAWDPLGVHKVDLTFKAD